MKKRLGTILLAGLLTSIVLPAYSQGSKSDVKKNDNKKTMTWTTSSSEARALAGKGAEHLMNVELAEAYENLTDAVKIDPDFTVALVFLNNLTSGDLSKMYAQKAMKSSINKTEGEKMFASLTDEKMTADERRAVWEKLYKMFPDGSMIGHYYTITRATPEERFNAAQEYINKFPKEAAMHNTLAYYYMQDKKDMTQAKAHFDKYIAMYPEGCNPYDSMGEYYLNNGDKENAEKYYKLALQKYPFNNSSLNALEKLNTAKQEKSAAN